MPSNPYHPADPLAKRWDELMAQGNDEAAFELASFNPPKYPDPQDLPNDDDDDHYFYADEPDSEFDEAVAAEDEKYSDVAAGAELDWRKL